MKILVCLLHFGYYRNFESVIRELARRGHHVHVAAERGDRDRARHIVDTLARDYSTITVGNLPSRERDDYLELTKCFRLSFDYLRYLGPAYRSMPGLRMRSEDRVPVGLLRLLSTPGMRTLPMRVLVQSTLRGLERAIPPSQQIERYLLEERPDALLITPLIGVVASCQFDYLATAKRLGIPTGFCVWSWDNLSSKALVRETPDRVFVWNQTQKDEAVRLHGLPASNIVVTGAQCYDQWFGRSPSRSREQFCREVGLPADRPYILYVGSTMVWKCPPEGQFAVRWIRHIRQSANAALRNASILIRPHPARLDEWTDVDVSGFERIAFSGSAAAGGGRGAGLPMEDTSKADYFDALFHSAAVVGLNTSAFIEAGILGKPVYAILAEEFWGGQAGTVHFHYLTRIGGGVVQAGRAFDEHEAQLAEALDGRSARQTEHRHFLEAFVRPHGLDVPATPIFADAVESLAQRTGAPSPARPPFLASAVLRRLAENTRSGRGKLLLMTRDEFAAATINESPRKPYLQKVAVRTSKRLKRAGKRVRTARKRTVAVGLRVAIHTTKLLKRARKSVSTSRKRTVALGLRIAAAARGLVIR